MSDDYTPSTDEVRSMFCIGISDPTNPKPVPARQAYDGYDRWLAAHEESVRAEERERIAHNIEAALPGPDEPRDGWVCGMEEAARIAREGAS